MVHTETEGLSLGIGCDIHPDVVFEIDPGAIIVLGDRVSIRRGTTLQANRGSQILIGDDVAIGENVFISSMVGIVIGSGVGVSNQVDIRDHNHVARTTSLGEIGLQPWASGFTAAPIIIERAALLSNKVSVTAGVCIGRNSIIGANSVVTRHVEQDVVVVGAPSRAIREFDGVQIGATFRPPFTVGWIGTSIMEHREARSAALELPWPVPEIGECVEITRIETGGYVRLVTDDLIVRFPHMRISTHNYAFGGATSRDLANLCRELEARNVPLDVTFFGCGLNDVWRGFQGKMDDAVDLPEFVDNVSTCLSALKKISRQVIYVEETSFGLDVEGLPTREMNIELARYMAAVRGIVAEKECDLVPVTRNFERAARALEPETSLWKDGVHLSGFGDHFLGMLIIDHLRSKRTVERLSEFVSVDRKEAPARFQNLLNDAAEFVIGRRAR